MSVQMFTLNGNEMKKGYTHNSEGKVILAHLCGFCSKSQKKRELCNDTYSGKRESSG